MGVQGWYPQSSNGSGGHLGSSREDLHRARMASPLCFPSTWDRDRHFLAEMPHTLAWHPALGKAAQPWPLCWGLLAVAVPTWESHVRRARARHAGSNSKWWGNRAEPLASSLAGLFLILWMTLRSIYSPKITSQSIPFLLVRLNAISACQDISSRSQESWAVGEGMLPPAGSGEPGRLG